MFYDDYILNSYFEWLIGFIEQTEMSYYQLLKRLFETEFTYTIPFDENRACDGLDLRSEFTRQTNYILELDKPCSVLEMMIALAIRCEQDIMHDFWKGDRTSIWFWLMIQNLGLLHMTDYSYKERFVQDVLYSFLNSEYEPDGKGGLFYVPGRTDMTSLEIWSQMNYYLANYIETDGDD